MDVSEAIRIRRSVRAFKPDPVPEEMLVELIAAAREAPSSLNLQPWEFIIVTDDELKKRLPVRGFNEAHVTQAPATIICLASMRQQDRLADAMEASLPLDAAPERRAQILTNVDTLRHNIEFRKAHIVNNTYIGIAWLVMKATELGLGSLWMGGFDARKTKELFQIGDDYEVVSMVAVGYAAEPLTAQPRKRRPLEELYSFNRFVPR